MSKMNVALVLLFVLIVRSGYCFQSLGISDSVGVHQIFRSTHISPDEKWMAYQVHYGEVADTLFLQSLETERQWSFSGNARVMFDTGSHWAMISAPGQPGELIDLLAGKMYPIPHGTQAVFREEGQSLVLWQSAEEQLISIDLDSHHQTLVKGVDQFWIGPGRDLLVVGREGGLYQFNGDRVESWKLLFQGSSSKYSRPVWAGQGASLLFYDETPEGKVLCHLSMETQVLRRLELKGHGLPYRFYAGQGMGSALRTTEDGEWVFVPVQDKVAMEEDPVVERWRSNTPSLYPKELSRRGRPLYAAWNPRSNKCFMIGKNHADNLIPIRNTHQVLIYDESLYQADYVNNSRTDFRLIDLDRGVEEMLLEGMNLGYDFLNISPDSKYIAYFKEEDWWLYDLVKGQHINLTKEIPTTWAGIGRYGMDLVPHDQPTWLASDNSIVLEDEYDLWSVRLKDLSFERLTHGREREVYYQVDHMAYRDIDPYRSYHGRSFSLEEGLLLKMGAMNQDKGYAVYGQKGLKPVLPLQAAYFERMKKTNEGYYWVQEAFNEPPELWYRKTGDNKPILIKGLNMEIANQHLGTNLLISYTNSFGNRMQGILYYPPGFIPSHQYPMVVHIYQKQSSLLNRFVMPGYKFNNIGWNIANLLRKGYMVFLPDIEYELGSPGPSALDNVESGVRAVMEKGIVKPKSIGLYGHSFGAYEAAFILTHSKLFATGVLGSGVYDLIGQYLNYNEAYGQKPDLWRFETQQFRMGGGLYDNFQNYLDNSPMYHLGALNVPLMIWAGREDPNVTWHQSLELHIALRRIGKTHEFLVFPDQGHVMMDSNARETLTMEIETWWDRHLK